MIEVFKTGVCNISVAQKLVREINEKFPEYKANFDLDDCDHILRVVSETGPVVSTAIVALLARAGYDVEILPDTVPEQSHEEICEVHSKHGEYAFRSNYLTDICLHLRRINGN